jgi:hypothetical protein
MIFDADDGTASWILGAFVEEARLNLLRDMVGGVTGVHVDLNTSPSGSLY